MGKNLARSLPKSTPEDKGVRSKWEECLRLIKEEIPAQSFQTWISPIIPVSYVDGQLYLRVPSQFFYEWIKAHYEELIHRAAKKIFGFKTKLDYLVPFNSENQPEELNLDSRQETTSTIPPIPVVTEEVQLDCRYQFDNFLVRHDNELALRAAKEVAAHPGKTDYNPLFIYGDSGFGKTHLLTAIGNFILVNRKRKKVRLIPCEIFINEYIFAVQNKKMEIFHKKFNNLDVLLLDDLQYLSYKRKSQETLLYLLSNLERQRKQIVITSNQAPAHLVGFDIRLISFLKRGLIVDLLPPSYDTRLAWIDAYAKKNNLALLPEVRELLAQTLGGGLHRLRAIMVRIAAQTSLLRKPVSLSNAKRLLSQFDAQWAQQNGRFHPTNTIKIDEIIQVVSEYMNVPQDILIGSSRRREVNLARQIAIYLARELSGEPLKVIGYHFGDRHYSAIIHNYNKVKEELKKNPVLHQIILEIQNKLTKK